MNHTILRAKLIAKAPFVIAYLLAVEAARQVRNHVKGTF